MLQRPLERGAIPFAPSLETVIERTMQTPKDVSAPMRDFILWHRKGRFELGRTFRLPAVVSSLLADQDGLFGSACVQYRDSMNDVADWAKGRGLMDHTGSDCVPRQVSLLEAHVNQPARVALLQHSDGYGPELEVGAELPDSYQPPAAEIEGRKVDQVLKGLVERVAAPR